MGVVVRMVMVVVVGAGEGLGVEQVGGAAEDALPLQAAAHNISSAATAC